MEEIWKTIEGYEDYQVSNYGRVKSKKCSKEKISKLSITKHGYYTISLYKDKIKKTMNVYQLIAIAFLNHKPCGMDLVVNHKDFNKLNNHVDNLEIVTQRENTNKKHIKSISVFTGVTWCKSNKKWVSQILINNKKIHLGYFLNEIDAHNAYQNKLKKII